MKLFLLFVGCYFYPNGGWEDYVNSFDTLEEAKTWAIENTTDPYKPAVEGKIEGEWYQIFNSRTGELVKGRCR